MPWPRKKKGIISGLSLLLTTSIADFICVAISQSFEFLFPKEITSLDPAEIHVTSKIRSPKESDTSFESNRTKEYAKIAKWRYFSYHSLRFNYLVLLPM